VASALPVFDSRTNADHSPTATRQPPPGLTAWVLVDKLVADLESRDRSANSAETDSCSLVIGVFELANSTRNDLGSIYG
jgi:hypothetical protein